MDRVVPVAVFLRGGTPAGPLVLGTERRPYLTFEYLACRLAETHYERWRESRNVAALVNLPNMRVPEECRVDAYAAAVRGLGEVEPDAGRRAKYMEFIDTYAGLDDDEYRRYERDYAEESKAMTGMIQRARNEGRREGRQEGRQDVLERLLRRRFGPLSAGVAERLRRASVGEIEAWADNVLDADTLDDVFRPGAA